MKVEDIKLAFEVNIKFAISDDLKNAADASLSANQALLKTMSDYKVARQTVMTASVKAEQARNSQTKVMGVAETKAKELGVPPSSVPGYSEASKAFDTVQKTLDDVDDLLDI